MAAFGVSLSLDPSTILPSTGQNKCYGNILFYKTSVFTVKMADNYRNQRCLVENNVSIALLFPNRWQDGAESLELETPKAVYCESASGRDREPVDDATYQPTVANCL